MALVATIVIGAIGTQQQGVPFKVTATYVLDQSTWTDELIYEDNGGAPVPIASPNIALGTSSVSFTHPGNLAPGTHTVTLTDRLTGDSATSNAFLVIAAHEILPAVISGAVAGVTFTFTGALQNYLAVPSLTYRLDGGAAVAMTGVTLTGWSTPIVAPAAGTHSITVSDGAVTSSPLSFTVSPVTVNHVITPALPGSVAAGATFTFAGALSGYTTAPSLTYSVNSSPPLAVAGVTATGWSMQVVAPATAGSYVFAVTDGTTAGNATLVVTAAARVISPQAPTNAVAGQSFTFQGTLSGYTTIPALTYSLDGAAGVAVTGVSVTGWAMTLVVAAAGSHTVTVTDGTVTSSAVGFTVSPVNTGTRAFYQSPGMDGSFWVQPFQSSANWITSGTLVTALRSGSPSINVKGNYGVPFYIGQATDPQVTVTDGSHSIVVRVPLGAVVETPTSAFDQSIGGADATQPYLVWSISGATINTGSVQASGSVITGTYGFAVNDGSGLIMVDAVTGEPGDNNSIGGIQNYELALIQSNPNYVIQHMLAFQLDTGQANDTALVWPLKVIDTSATFTGTIPQGITIGIPANVARPAGQTRGFYALWDQMQQFGMFNYNFGATGGVNFVVYDSSGAYASLVADLVASWPAVAAQACILNYASGVSGAQYSLATTKGAIAGSTNAFPAPPPLDLSPTNGVNVAPSTFGAWYPSGYNAVPTNGGSGPPALTITPNAPSGVVAGVSFTFSGSLGGYSVAPSLTYALNGGAATALPGVTSTGWSATLTISAAGTATVVVTDAADGISATVSFAVAATGTVTQVTWNPSDLSGVTLSNNNRTATAVGSATPYAAPQGVRATAAVTSAKPTIWQVTFTAITQNCATGVANLSALLDVTGGLGSDGNSVGAYPSTGTGSQPPDTVYEGGNQLTAGNGVASVAGAQVSCALVNGNSFFFSDAAMRSTAGVGWNNSTSANPVTNTGGFPLTTAGSALYPVFATGEGGGVAVLNDGTQPFDAFLAAFAAANPGTVVTLSGQAATAAKIITPAAPSGVVVGASFSFTGTLSGYATAPTLTYSLNGATPVALSGVTAIGWSATLVTQLSGQNTISVTDGSVTGSVTFSTQSQSGFTRVPAPLTGTVTAGTWVVNQRFSLAGSPSGLNYMNYNYRLPAQYNPAYAYPLLLVGHPNDNGMNGSSYPKDGTAFVTGAAYGGSYSLDTMFNQDIYFQTHFPCVVVACETDQTGNSGGTNANGVPGYNDSQNSSWNEQAINGIVQSFIAGSVVPGLQVDPGKRYVIGYSLGGYLTLASTVDNNQWATPAGGLALWTAGITYSDGLYRPATPNANVFARMATVPLVTISTTSDNDPTAYDEPAWTYYTGGSTSYPTQSTYDSGGLSAIRAGTSQYHYINYGSGQPAQTFMPTNANGGDGTALYAWLFSQVYGGAAPAITGVMFSPATVVAANSPAGTVAGALTATSSGGSLTGLAYSVSPSTSFTASGGNLVFATSTVAAGSYVLTVTVSASNALNSPQSYAADVTVGAAGGFTVSNGRVLTPNGATFVGRGVAIPDFDLAARVTNAACQPLLTLFPGCNFVRLSQESGQWAPSTYAQQIGWLTAQKIVVCIENHVESNGATGGGGQGVVYTGTLLANEQAWYAALATYFLNNPYVWFGTCNEPPTSPSLAALWAWQQTTYNTIRATGNTTIVEIEQPNPYQQGSNSGLSNTVFSQMRNIVYGPHYYSWIWKGNGSTLVPQTTIYSSAIGSANSQWGGIVQQVQTLQTLTSLDGVVPVGCFEYGPSTDGTNLDVSGANDVAAVIQAVASGVLFGGLAWWYDSLGADALITSSGALTSPYGTTVAAAIAVSTAPPQAAAVGYNTVTYGPNLVLGTTPDPATSFPSFANGVNIVPFSFFGTGWSAIPITVNADGSLSMTGVNTAFGGGMCTAATGVSGSSRLSFTGIAFGGGGYFEVVMKGNGPMSFWANDIETMNGTGVGAGPNPWPGQPSNFGNFGDWIETDIAEFDSTGNYGWAVHNWYGYSFPGNSFGGVEGYDPSSNFYYDVTPNWGGPLNNFNGPPAGVDYTQYNKYGMLWVPATASTLGYIQMYFNGIPVSNKLQWNKYNPALIPPPTVGAVTTTGSVYNTATGFTAPGSAWSVLDTLHLALIFGAQEGGGDLVTFQSCTVWQASDAGNLHGAGP